MTLWWNMVKVPFALIISFHFFFSRESKAL